MGMIDLIYALAYPKHVGRRINATELEQRLSEGIVRFSYYTKSGIVRDAIGTRNLGLARRLGYRVPSVKGGTHRPNTYFDLEKRWWRSYCPENVISINR